MKLYAWALYDFANTAFSALFVTLFFPFYIKEFLGGNELQIGLVFGLSMLFVAVLVPLIGTYSDITLRRASLVKHFTILCVICTMLVGLVGLYPALFLGFLANFFYHACLVVYNATIMDVAHNKRTLGSISAFGVAVGYLGTIVSVLMALGILYVLGAESAAGFQVMFSATAIFFLVFALPFFFKVPDPANNKKHRFMNSLRHSITDLNKTVRKLHKHKGMLSFLAASLSYSNAITAAVVFLFLYSREPPLQMAVQDFMILFIGFALASAGGSYLAGKAIDFWSARNTLILSGAIWVLVVAILIYAQLSSTSRETIYTVFLAAGLLGGAAMGGILAANRPMLIALAPQLRVGQFFGFTELTDKLSGVLGPIVFGWLVVMVGYWLALVSLIVFFLIGIACLFYVPNLRPK